MTDSMTDQDAAKRVECQNNWPDGTCPKCGEAHYILVRRGAIDAAVAEAYKERDRLYMEMGKTIARQVAEARREEREGIIAGLIARSIEYERKRQSHVRDGIESSEGTWYRGLRAAIEREIENLRRPPASAPEGEKG